MATSQLLIVLRFQADRGNVSTLGDNRELWKHMVMHLQLLIGAAVHFLLATANATLIRLGQGIASKSLKCIA